MKPTLGFVGLGNMGLPMCRRLIDQGYTVFLYDVNPEAFIPFKQRVGNMKRRKT